MMPPRPAPHQAALRRGRASLDGQAYLLTACTARRERLFVDWRAGRCVVDAMRHLEDAGRVTSLAWVVMPDHWHWLVQLSDCEPLSNVMNQVKGRSARAINLFLHRTGAVWQAGYHDHALRRDEDLLAAARYVVGNPVRAGLVERIADYALWDMVWQLEDGEAARCGRIGPEGPPTKIMQGHSVGAPSGAIADVPRTARRRRAAHRA